MKRFRFALIFIFLLTCVASPVQAKETARYGFIMLVKKADSKLPLWVQSQQAFDRWLPQLMAAKEKGEILDFAPEFDLGVLKIKYALGTNGLTFGRETIFDDVQEAIRLMPRKAITQLEPVVIDTPVFNISVWQDCIYVTAWPNSHIVANMRDQAGVTLINYDFQVYSGNTTGYYCFEFSEFPELKLQPGYQLTYKIYSNVTGRLRGTYQATIPNIEPARFDKKNSMVSGTGPANRPYSIEWFHDNLDTANTKLDITKKKSSAADGTWQMDFGTTPIRGGDSFNIAVKQNANFVFNRYMVAPYIRCELSSNYCIAHGIPFTRATVTITHPALFKNNMFEGKYDELGAFEVKLIDDAYFPIQLAIGDKISVNGITPYTLPRLEIIRVPSLKTVSGYAPANKYFQLVSWWKIYHDDDGMTFDWLHTKADGSYTSSEAYGATEETYSYLINYRDPGSGNFTQLYDPYKP